jgi:hypothetical protein
MNKMIAYPDDRIETHSGNHASMTFNGNTIIVLGNTNLKLEANAAELISGGTVVSTTTRYAVHSGCFSVQPSSASARYSVVPYQGRIYIHAEEGEVIVKNGMRCAFRRARRSQSGGAASPTKRLVSRAIATGSIRRFSGLRQGPEPSSFRFCLTT